MIMRKKLLAVLLSAVMSISVLAGCGQASGAEEAATEPKQEEVKQEEGEEKAETANADQEASAGSDYSGLKICYANANDKAAMFAGVGANVKDTCEKAGIELVYFDNNNDAETTISNAKLMVQEEPDFIIEYSPVEGLTALKQIFEGAGIPYVCVNVPIEGGYWFNLSNKNLGVETADIVVPIAQEKGWTADDTVVVCLQAAKAGEEVNDCVRYFYITVAEKMGMTPAEPSDITATTTNIGDHLYYVEGNAVMEESYTAVKNILQSIPEEKHILLYGVNNDSTSGGWRAVEESGRAANTLVAGLGGDEVGMSQLKNNESWVAEGSIFTNYWGTYSVAMAVAILKNGVTPPEITHCPQMVFTKENWSEYYDDSNNIIGLPELIEGDNDYLADTGILQLYGLTKGLE